MQTLNVGRTNRGRLGETLADEIAAGIASVADLVGDSVTLISDTLRHVDRLVADVLDDAAAVARDAEALYDVAVESIVPVRDALRATPRLARVLLEAGRLVAAYRIHERSVPWRRPAENAAALEALHRDSAERIYRLCVELRGGVLKLGQFASTRMDILPQPYVDALGRLQDQVPAVPYEEIAARIEGELGAPPERLFRSFDTEPIAAASLAQVHAAVLDDGTRVVVKVQVPGIEDIVTADLTALSVLAHALGDLVPWTDLESVANELDRAVRMELDYGAEAEHARTFARHFSADPNIVIPRVFGERSSHRVLTLERLDGERLIPYLEGCESRGAAGMDDRDRVLASLVRSLCVQVLEHGCFHADPHPGNFLVLDGPRVGIVDFGCVMTYTADVRSAYAQLAAAILAGDGQRAGALFDTLGFRTRGTDADALRRFAEIFLEAFRTDTTLDRLDVDPGARLARVLNIVRANPVVQIPQHFVLLGRVFTAVGGLLMRFRPRINLMQIVLPYLAPHLGQQRASGTCG